MELLLILIIVLIIFGAGKIPQLGEGLGKAIKGFKKSVNEPDSIDVTASPEQQQQTPPTQIQSGQPQPGTTQNHAQPQVAPQQEQTKHG
jgi:sec-independent protein translocase protein TatA